MNTHGESQIYRQSSYFRDMLKYVTTNSFRMECTSFIKNNAKNCLFLCAQLGNNNLTQFSTDLSCSRTVQYDCASHDGNAQYFK